MATIIRPKSGQTWDLEFPDAYAESEGDTYEGKAAEELYAKLGRAPKWYTLNAVLYLLAAFFSRGTVKIKASERARCWVMNIIVTSFVNDNRDDYDDDKQMANLGRHVYWLVKALDTEPSTWREYGRFANQPKVEIGDPASPA